jgi:hypothetical protein
MKRTMTRIACTRETADGRVTEFSPPSVEVAIKGLVDFSHDARGGYLCFFAGPETLFLATADGGNLHIQIKAQDKWNLMAFLGTRKNLDMDYGLVDEAAGKELLKRFYSDDYPALRALHQALMSP